MTALLRHGTAVGGAGTVPVAPLRRAHFLFKTVAQFVVQVSHLILQLHQLFRRAAHSLHIGIGSVAQGGQLLTLHKNLVADGPHLGSVFVNQGAVLGTLLGGQPAAVTIAAPVPAVTAAVTTVTAVIVLAVAAITVSHAVMRTGFGGSGERSTHEGCGKQDRQNNAGRLHVKTPFHLTYIFSL